MFYERRVQTFDKLMRELRHLDSDSGVRVVGSYLGRDCFAFLARFVGTYTIMIYERRGGKTPELGARILSKEFDSVDDLGRFLRQIIKKGVDAYVY